MIYNIISNEKSGAFDYNISELGNFSSIPDPNLKCSFVYGDFMYSIIGTIPHINANIPIGYRISLTDWYIEPIGMSLQGLSDIDFITAGIKSTLDLPFSKQGFVYSDGSNDWLVTIVKTSSVYNGYVFVKMGLTPAVNGSTLIKKIPELVGKDISDICFTNNKLSFLIKPNSATASYSETGIYDVSNNTASVSAITTPLRGSHSVVGYNDKMFLIGGKEWDQGLGIEINVSEKIYQVDLFSPSTLIVNSLAGNSSTLPNTLVNAPATIIANRAYVMSSAPDNAMYMINIDSFVVARRKFDESGTFGYGTFIYNSNVYLYNPITLSMWSQVALKEVYLVAANNVQFTVNDPIQLNSTPYFKYDIRKITDSIVQEQIIFNKLIAVVATLEPLALAGSSVPVENEQYIASGGVKPYVFSIEQLPVMTLTFTYDQYPSETSISISDDTQVIFSRNSTDNDGVNANDTVIYNIGVLPGNHTMTIFDDFGDGCTGNFTLTYNTVELLNVSPALDPGAPDVNAWQQNTIAFVIP